jgi:hypothetical protein
MRRRVLPLLLTAAAAVVALVRRSRRREAAAQPRYVPQAPHQALKAPAAPGHVAIADPVADRDIMPDPQVEGEISSTTAPEADSAEHNADTGPATADAEPERSAEPDADAEPEPPAAPDQTAQPEPAAPRPAPDSPFRSVAWELLDGDSPADDATELRIGFSLIGRHESLARVDVRETDSQVFVTVLARFDPPEGGWFAYAEAHQATVTLSRPLGDRALVHAPVTPDRPAG